MEWQIIVALVVAIPVILLPVAFIWFINITGLWAVWKENRARQRKRAKAAKEALVKVVR